MAIDVAGLTKRYGGVTAVAPQACGVQRHRAECVRFPRLLIEFPEEVEGLPPVADSLT